MIAIPPCDTTVDGLAVLFVQYDQNLAAKGVGAELLEDGYLKMRIQNDGTHPYTDAPSFWELRFVQLRHDKEVEVLCNAHFEVVTMLPGWNLQQVQVRECTLENLGSGVWLFIELREEQSAATPVTQTLVTKLLTAPTHLH